MEPILYKKKITTIVNEYYKMLENGRDEDEYQESPVYTNNEVLSLYPPGQPPQFDSTTFRESVNSYFDSYSRKMQDLISAIDKSDDEMSAAEENLFRDIWTIGTIMRPLYSAEFCEKLLQQFRSFALSQIQLIYFSRDGLDTKNWTDRITNFPVNDLANILSNYNNNFDRETVRNHWTIITNSWLAAIRAKIAKDAIKFDENIKIANQHIKDFAAYLAEGVIKQKSNMFLPQPTL
jgi:hypothetical protein